MSRRSPKWRRPVSKPRIVVSMPQQDIVVAQSPSHDEMVTLMKQVAEDVVLLANALPAKHGAF